MEFQPGHISLEQFNAIYSALNDCSKLIPTNPGHEINYLKFHRDRFLKTLRLVPQLPPASRLLDIGTGYLSLLIHKFYGYHIDTIDVNNLWNNVAQKEGWNFRICDLMIEEIPFAANNFDLALFCEVLEHIPIPPAELLQKIAKVLKYDAYLILTTPNLSSLYKRIKLLLGVSPIESFSLAPLPPPAKVYSHYREFTMAELCSCLENCHYKIVKKVFEQCWNLPPSLAILYPLLDLVPSLKDDIMIVAQYKGPPA